MIASIIFYFRKSLFGHNRKINNSTYASKVDGEVTPFVTFVDENYGRQPSNSQLQFLPDTLPIDRPSKSMLYISRLPPPATTSVDSVVPSNPSISPSQSRASGTRVTLPALQVESLVDRIVEMVSRRIGPQMHNPGGNSGRTFENTDFTLPPYSESL